MDMARTKQTARRREPSGIPDEEVRQAIEQAIAVTRKYTSPAVSTLGHLPAVASAPMDTEESGSECESEGFSDTESEVLHDVEMVDEVDGDVLVMATEINKRNKTTDDTSGKHADTPLCGCDPEAPGAGQAGCAAAGSGADADNSSGAKQRARRSYAAHVAP